MSPSRLRGSSLGSDSDEEYLLLTAKKKTGGSSGSSRVSPTRIRPHEPDPSRLIRARVRHTHSMFNLTEGLESSSKRSAGYPSSRKYQQNHHHHIRDNIDPVYATIHGKYSSSPPVRESGLGRHYSIANVMPPDDIEDYVLEELDDEEFYEPECVPQQQGAWRSGSPSSSGYKTMGPYSYHNTLSNAATDPVIAKFIRERRIHQQNLQLSVVREDGDVEVLGGFAGLLTTLCFCSFSLDP